MSWKQTLVKGRILNAIIRVQKGTLEVERFIQDAPRMWWAGLNEGIFNDTEDFRELLLKNNFPADKMEDIEDALLFGE